MLSVLEFVLLSYLRTASIISELPLRSNIHLGNLLEFL